MHGLAADVCVACLIDEARGYWREDVLREIFFDVDVVRIKNIHLRKRAHEDVL